MDFRFPEFPPTHDRTVDATPRRGRADDSNFNEILDHSLNEQTEKSRETADDKQAPKTDSDRDQKVKERTSTRAEKKADRKGEPDSSTDSSVVAASSADSKPQPAAENNTPASDVVAPADPAAQSSEPANAQGTNDAPVTAQAVPLVAPNQTPAIPAPAVGAPPTEQSVVPQAAVSSSNGTGPVSDQVAQTPPDSVPPEPTQQADFPAELAAATAKPAGSVAVAPKSKSKTESSSVPVDGQAALQPLTEAAPSSAAPELTGLNGDPARDPRHANGDAVVAQVPAAVTVSSATSDTADDARIAAIVHQTNGSAANRTVTKDEVPVADPASNILPKDDGVEAKLTPTEHTKADGGARPFGTLAPGLGIAAQITGQQTPDHADEAARLAQLANTAEAETHVQSTKAATETSKTADTAAASARIDQAVPVEAVSARHATVDSSTAAAAARSARAPLHPVIAQVAAHVAQAVTDGNDRINIRLSPAELGRIDVRLDFGPDGRIQAVFAADRAQTLDLLQRDARDLERALQDAGLRADSGSLSFNLRGDGRQGGQDSTPSGRGGYGDPVVEAPLPQVQAYSAGSAGSGRLDIRI